MTQELEKALKLLFSAKWNIPTASKYANVTDDEMKVIFSTYCQSNPPTYQ